MSSGVGGYMSLITADDTMFIYSYCCYNINHDNWREMQTMEDGEIYIHKSALIEPEIHHKVTRLPGGRKKIIEKRIPREVSFSDMLNAELITIKNASGTWMKNSEGVDLIAYKLLFKLFQEYQETGCIPEHISFFS